MLRDRFGNEHAAGVPYARGKILTGTEDDFRKVRQAWRHIEARVNAGGPGAVFNFSGLEHDQPRTLQLGVDLVATGLDEYGTVGPRLGVLAGDTALVGRIRGRAYASPARDW